MPNKKISSKSRSTNNIKKKNDSVFCKKYNKNKKKPHLIDYNKSHNQTIAILLFSFSIIFLFLVLIKGENIWKSIHMFLWGIFGVTSILCPFVLIYISIITSRERTNTSISSKICLSVVFIILVCTIFYVFRKHDKNSEYLYWHQLLNLYNIGSNINMSIVSRGAGLFSGLIGIPLVVLLGTTGARIVIIVLFFVDIMLLTETTIVDLFKVFKKSSKYQYELINSQKNSSNSIDNNFVDIEKKQIKLRRSKTKIDIPIDHMPNHPVQSPIIQADKLEEKRIKKIKNILSNDKESNSLSSVTEAFLEKNLSKNFHSEIENLHIKSSETCIDGGYKFPAVNLLEKSQNLKQDDIQKELLSSGHMLVETLNNFNVSTKIVDISRGPAVTRYELQPAAGVKISKITNLSDDISLNLATAGVRIEAPIPGKAAVGVEVPNKIINIVRMRELLGSNEFFESKSKLTVVLGKDIAGNVSMADLSKMPHLLIAGSTGAGKSVCINSFIISLLYKASPGEVRLLMIDPKVVELGIYNGIPHLLVPVVTDPRKAAGSLNWAVNEMLKRYKIFAENNVRDLISYNKKIMKSKKNANKCFDKEGNELEIMPQIVIIIDELADLMMAAPSEVEDSICRLAQMARAAGMHLVIATQRPSVDVITGIIKANIPSRVALAVSSQIDSRTILDMAGAEKLLGRGDMLFSPVGSQKPIRIQGCYVSDKEITSVIEFIKHEGKTEYDEKVIEEIEKNAVLNKETKSSKDIENKDPMLDEAIKCVVEGGQASTSLLQRRLRLGYARAGRLIDEMEQMGIVGPYEGSKPRQVLMSCQQLLEMNMRKGDG